MCRTIDVRNLRLSYMPILTTESLFAKPESNTTTREVEKSRGLNLTLRMPSCFCREWRVNLDRPSLQWLCLLLACKLAACQRQGPPLRISMHTIIATLENQTCFPGKQAHSLHKKLHRFGEEIVPVLGRCHLSPLQLPRHGIHSGCDQVLCSWK